MGASAAAEEPAADTTGSQEAEALLAPEGGSGGELDTSKVAAPAAWEGDAVLPWWLPPERIPAAFSGGQLGGGQAAVCSAGLAECGTCNRVRCARLQPLQGMCRTVPTFQPLSTSDSCPQRSMALPACWPASLCAACASACCPARRRGGQCGSRPSDTACCSCLQGRRHTGVPAGAAFLLACVRVVACLWRCCCTCCLAHQWMPCTCARHAPSLCRELQRMLRAHPPQDPPSVHIELRAGSVAAAGQQEGQPARKPSGNSWQDGSESGSEAVTGAASAASAASLTAPATDSQPAGAMADAAAAHLSSALQVWARHRLSQCTRASWYCFEFA